MKKLLSILIFSIIIISSCQKERCWECTIRTIVPGQNNIITTVQQCGLTKSEIKDVEKQGTNTATSGGITVQQVTSCVED